VRDNDIVAVHRAHQIADDTVLIDRHFLGIQMLRPFRLPGPFCRCHFFLERRKRVTPTGTLLPAYLGDQRIEHQGGVADERMLDAVFLVDVGSLVR
jgi:hypothetical protein